MTILPKSRVEPKPDCRRTEADGTISEMPIPSSGIKNAVDDNNNKGRKDRIGGTLD